MSWELISKQTDSGFTCEMPSGTYVIGSLFEMLRPEIFEQFENLEAGTYRNTTTNEIVCFETYNCDSFGISVTTNDTDAYTIDNDSGNVAILSYTLARQNVYHQDYSIVTNTPVKIEANTKSIKLVNDELMVLIEEINIPDETDEEMYTRAYAAIGVTY